MYLETLKIFCKKKYEKIEGNGSFKSVSTFELSSKGDDEDDN